MTMINDCPNTPINPLEAAIADAKFWMGKASEWQAKYDRTVRDLDRRIEELNAKVYELTDSNDKMHGDLLEERARGFVLAKTVVGLLRTEFTIEAVFGSGLPEGEDLT